MDNTQRFTGLAVNYRLGRPPYPPALLAYLYGLGGLTPQSVVADVGAGTGIWSQALLQRGNTVYCVEPNDDMRHTAAATLAAFPNCHLLDGTAAQTTLADHSIDYVTTAQAFHWFEPQAFRRECLRILRPQGRAALIWNIRDQSAPVHQDSYAIYQTYCPSFQGFHNGLTHDDSRIQTFFGDAYTYVTFDNPIVYTEDTFIQRHLSNSYSLRPDEPRYEAFIEALKTLFHTYATNGQVIMPCRTVAYIGFLTRA